MTASRSAGATLSRNTTVTVVTSLLYLLTRIGLPPLILNSVSVEEYGIWSACFILISYIGMGAFGVSNAYIRYSAEYAASQAYGKIGRLVSAGLILTLSLSLGVLLALWFAMPWVIAWFKIPPAHVEVARILILGSVATMLLDLTFGAFSYVLAGLQKIAENKYVWMVSYLLETALTVTLLKTGHGIVSLLWAFLARYLFSTLIYVVMVYRSIPGFRLNVQGLGRRDFLPFLQFGGILQLSGMVSVFLYSIEKIFAGRLAGVGAVAVLDVGQKIPMMGCQVFAAFSSSFMPAVTHLHTLGQHEEIRRLYVRATRYMNLLIGTAMGFIVGFASLILKTWIGTRPELDDMATVMLAAAIGFHIHELTGSASAYYQGIHKPWRPFEYLLLQLLGIATALAYILLTEQRSIVVIAVAAATVRAIGGMIFLMRANRSMGVRFTEFLGTALLPGLLPYLWGWGLGYLSAPWLPVNTDQRLHLLAVLLALGTLHATWTLAFFWLGLARREERRQLLDKLLRRNRLRTAVSGEEATLLDPETEAA